MRLATLVFFVAHLLLRAAAAAHIHDGVAGPGGGQPASRPHVHLGPHGHASHGHADHATRADRAHGGHSHDHAVDVGSPGPRAVGDGDESRGGHADDMITIDLDALTAGDVRQLRGTTDRGERGVVSWATGVAACPRSSRAGASSAVTVGRPPGDGVPLIHQLRPHVLRI